MCFLDFNNFSADKISLVRISFDGFGCCELGTAAVPLDRESSIKFKSLMKNKIQDQLLLDGLVKEAIKLNAHLIWTDALQEYDLI